MASEEFDYTPRAERDGRRKERPPRGGSRTKDSEEVADYRPQSPRSRGEAEESIDEEAIEYTPRPARRGRKARREEQDDAYTPRPPRKKRERRPPLWQREQEQRGGGRRLFGGSKGGRFFRSTLFWRLAALLGLVVLVVPTVLVAVLQDQGPPQDPQLLELLDRLERNPDNFDLLVEVANYYFEMGILFWDQEESGQALSSFESAAAYYERALRQDPSNSSVRTDLGTMYYYQGQIQGDTGLINQAIQAWQLALSYEPDKPETLFNLGIGYVALDNIEQAIATWQRVIEVAPGTDSAADAQRMIEQYGGP